MADRNWGKITSGAMFEALATTLVFFEDSKAALFGRQGKDGGQDARSGDGTLVYQAKHHEDESASKAIADAKKEASKISEYRKSGNSRYEQWKDITHWRLVTNATFNSTDFQRWKDELVPVFSALNLDIDYWERADLNALLDKYPEVSNSYFGDTTRTVLTLPEVREKLPQSEPYLQRAEIGKCFGREIEVEKITDFLSTEKQFLLVHGTGGIGKTRLVVEAGEKIAADGAWQVLWANITTMEMSDAWFQGIVPERRTLLIVDEPETDQILKLLTEQLGSHVGRAAGWKVCVAVRSPKDPVLRFLRGPRIKRQVDELPVVELSTPSAEEMCFDLLSSGKLNSKPEPWRKNAAQKLSKLFSQHPIWLTLAIYLLESHGDLSQVPTEAEEVAEEYLNEVVNQQNQFPRDQIRYLLRWISLIGPVNREDPASINLLREGSGVDTDTKTKQLLSNLIDRRAIVERGARKRLLEIKPDVLRDHLLMKWLSVDLGHGDQPVIPSDDAKGLITAVLQSVLSGTVSSTNRSVLTAVARTEMILGLSNNPVPLLSPFFEGIQEKLSQIKAPIGQLVAEVLIDVAAVRPSDTVSLCSSLRASSLDAEIVEGLLRSREITQNDVVLALAWAVYHAAFGAQTEDERTQILRELCDLSEAEADIGSQLPRGLPNDGKRAGRLIGRTLEGSPHFWGDFHAAAQVVGLELLDRVKFKSLTSTLASVLESLIIPAIAVERHVSWSDDRAIHWNKYTIGPGQPAWETRVSLVQRMKELLEDENLHIDSRIVLWKIVSEAHATVNRCLLQGEKAEGEFRSILLENLTWAKGTLGGRENKLEELSAARALWVWHIQFEKDDELKKAANNLEELYKGDSLAIEFEPLRRQGSSKQSDDAAVSKAMLLLKEEDEKSISAFFDRAQRFFSARDLPLVQSVAWRLGEHAQENDGVRSFVRNTLARSDDTPRKKFAVVAARRWTEKIRETEKETTLDYIKELLDNCSDDSTRILLLGGIYAHYAPARKIDGISVAELEFLRPIGDLFLNNDRGPLFITIISWAIEHDWEGLCDTLETALDKIPTEQIVSAVHVLVESMYWTFRERDPSEFPKSTVPWMMDQLLRIPDLDGIDHMVSWYFEEILKLHGRMPVTWLLKILTSRRDLEVERGYSNFHAIGHHSRPSRYVLPITAAQVSVAGTIEAVKNIVDFVDDSTTVGYDLPSILHDVDPEGHVLPHELVKRIESATEKDDVYRLARIGGMYETGSQVWRIIAKPVLVFSNKLTPEERYSPFRALTDQGSKSWSSTRGEVPELFIESVRTAQQLLDDEEDPVFQPFWVWNLEVAEAELRDQKEQAKEDRGE